jgi:hypothetical protein
MSSVNSLSESLTFLRGSLKKLIPLATSAKSLWIRKSAQERKEFLNMILSSPILDGVNVRYELKKPFAVLVKMSENPEKESWCGQRDSNSRHPGSKPGTLSS